MTRNYFLFYFFILFLSNNQLIYGQSFEETRAKYENLQKDDITALPYVSKYIKKAKKENDFLYLTQGYKDAGFFSPDVNIKLKYADSTIWAAKLSKDNDQITKAYLSKGIIYYFNLKRYKPALDEYLKAFEYSKNATDRYEYYRVIYHMGVVKCYLGYYTEALSHFTNCINYFEPLTKNKSLHPNLIYNNTKGYLNSLHQAIICYRNLGNFKAADSLINVGLSIAGNSKDFELEKAYFLKCRGILNYNQKKYRKSIKDFSNSLPIIIKNKDFAWESVGYFYKGKSYLANGDDRKAVQNFLKVDSIFHQNNFILPELRENYELLINDAKKKGDTQKELYYIKSLLKADSIINKDFVYLSSRIHKEYDTQSLVDSQQKIENNYSLSKILIFLLILIVGLLVTMLYYYNLREKKVKLKYKELQEKLKQRTSIIPNEKKEVSSKSTLSEEMINEILTKLEKWEKRNGFVEKSLTQNKLAKRLRTNDNYLSQVINDKRGMNFNKYLGELRINYITNKLYYEKKFLNYTVESLAEECGIASRQNFSDLFYTINGIRPADFIKQRKSELENKTHSTSVSSN